MKPWIRAMLMGTLILSMCACGKEAEKEELTPPTVEIVTKEEEISDESEKEQTTPADELTLEQKVGQLFIVRPDALNPVLSIEKISDSKAAGVTEVTDEMVQMLQKYPVGGICQFSKNIVSPAQLKSLNAGLQVESEIPLFITVDEEGGLVARIANNRAFEVTQYLRLRQDVICFLCR